jgi:hypothetical protein
MIVILMLHVYFVVIGELLICDEQSEFNFFLDLLLMLHGLH